jgi:hypothetical protein
LGVLAWIVGVRLRKKPLNHKTKLGLILLAIGLVETWDFIQHNASVSKAVRVFPNTMCKSSRVRPVPRTRPDPRR